MTFKEKIRQSSPYIFISLLEAGFWFTLIQTPLSTVIGILWFVLIFLIPIVDLVAGKREPKEVQAPELPPLDEQLRMAKEAQLTPQELKAEEIARERAKYTQQLPQQMPPAQIQVAPPVAPVEKSELDKTRELGVIRTKLFNIIDGTLKFDISGATAEQKQLIGERVDRAHSSFMKTSDAMLRQVEGNSGMVSDIKTQVEDIGKGIAEWKMKNDIK